MSDYPLGCADDPRAPWNEIIVFVACPECNDPVEHNAMRGGPMPDPELCEECREAGVQT